MMGRSHSICQEMPPRRVRSAVNLTTLVLLECDEEGGGNNNPSTSTGSITTTAV